MFLRGDQNKLKDLLVEFEWKTADIFLIKLGGLRARQGKFCSF